jgi:signal transduction histidine kinase
MQQILISAIVHDIKTPLRYFMWTARSLQQDLLKGDQASTFQERADLMYTSAERMHTLVEDLLNYYRIRLSGGAAIRSAPVDIRSAVTAKADLFQPIARSKGITIVNNVEEGLSIATDPGCFSVIVHNVLDNAVKFTTGGRVEIGSSVSGGSVRLEVADTGRGMSREYMDWCNKPDASLDEDFRPPGLGLLLIRELIGKTGGKMCVSRGKQATGKGSDEGTVMILEFPVSM